MASKQEVRERIWDLLDRDSVAVNRQGARIGKGGGFSDLEFALLVERGLGGASSASASTSPRSRGRTSG